MEKKKTSITNGGRFWIEKPTDAARFDGIVAFETNIDAFATEANQWKRPGAPGVYYGYISVEQGPNGESVPRLFTVKKPGSEDVERRVTIERLQASGSAGRPGFLLIREARNDEIRDIKKAVDAAEAKLEFNSAEFWAVLNPPPRAVHRRAAKALLNKYGR